MIARRHSVEVLLILAVALGACTGQAVVVISQIVGFMLQSFKFLTLLSIVLLIMVGDGG